MAGWKYFLAVAWVDDYKGEWLIEYKGEDRPLNEELNRLGSMGWELVGVAPFWSTAVGKFEGGGGYGGPDRISHFDTRFRRFLLFFKKTVDTLESQSEAG